MPGLIKVLLFAAVLLLSVAGAARGDVTDTQYVTDMHVDGDASSSASASASVSARAYIRILHACAELDDRRLTIVIPEHLRPKNDAHTQTLTHTDTLHDQLNRQAHSSNASFARAGHYATMKPGRIFNISLQVQGLPNKTYNVAVGPTGEPQNQWDGIELVEGTHYRCL
jgi:hypothetical protein